MCSLKCYQKDKCTVWNLSTWQHRNKYQKFVCNMAQDNSGLYLPWVKNDTSVKSPQMDTFVTSHLSASEQQLNSVFTVECLSRSAEWAFRVQPLTTKKNTLTCRDSHRENINPGISANTISFPYRSRFHCRGQRWVTIPVLYFTLYWLFYWLCVVHYSFWIIWLMYSQ